MSFPPILMGNLSQSESNKLLRPFQLNITPGELSRRVNIVRILFGLGLFHHFLDILGFAMMAPVRIIPNSLEGLLVSLMITFGFLTPLALLWLIIHFLVFPPVVNYLGTQVMIVIAWGLIFLGAGHSNSLDSKFARLPTIGWMFRKLYFLTASPTINSIAQIRFVILFLFWGICLCAMAFHVTDQLWLKGDVLQLMLVTPYFTDFYSWFVAFSRNSPRLYDLIWTTAISLQVAWELLLLPLMYFKWGRIFVFLHGAIFFLFSLIILNLGYLPFFEICLWLLLFYPCSSKSSVQDALTPTQGSRITRVVGSSFVVAALIIVGLHTTVNASRIMGHHWAVSWPNVKAWRVAYRLFGQSSVNVVNEADLQMGAYHFVLFETDAGGKVIRLVPFLDIHGGRLDYLRNDYLYFNQSLRWQRAAREMKFEPNDLSKVSKPTHHFMQKVIELDACLTERPMPRYYEVYVLGKQIISEKYFKTWTNEQPITSENFSLDREDILRLGATCRFAYNLPPGHWFSRSREQATMKALEAYGFSDF